MLNVSSRRVLVPMMMSVCVVAAVCSACGSPKSTSGAASSPTGGPAKPVRVAVARAISSLSPTGSSEYDLQTLGVIEMLGRPKTDTSGVEPNILSSWTQTDPTTWKLTVRPGISFQDGRAVDAQAIVDAINVMKATNKGATDTIATGTLSVSGPMEITLVTDKPTTEVPWDLSDPTLYPVFDAAAFQAAGNDPAKLLTAGIYTGPWVPASFSPNRLTFTANSKYWQGRPLVSGLEIDVITDAQARVAAVQNDEIDVDLNPPDDAATTLANSSQYVYKVATMTSVSTLALFNTTQAPFDNASVRRAIIAGTDFAELAKVAGGNFEAAGGLYPSSLPLAVNTQTYDPATAGSLLDAAGWTMGPNGVRTKGGASLNLTYVYSLAQGPGEGSIAVAFKDSLAKIGVDVQLKQVDNPYSAADRGPGWNIDVIGTNAEGDADPVDKSIGGFVGTGKPYNYTGVSDPAIDQALAGLGNTLDPAQRIVLDKDFERAVAAGGYAMSLGFTRLDALVTPPYKDYRVPFDPGYVPWNIHPTA
ncbi:MAG TPA: ABC transporter substrate-binding protein [Actinomycetota bacterium]|nr:ABC transporter substrate-binding protein [Actinomycetota bacterium]